ncbi:GTP-binding protein LepA [Cryptococcus depauperatus CBS 7841]|uniref:GTP-binding protein LepA n=1 Tax=Cryptococcus depauperatus CBS 7841 TaxID=1295531 RepID=A0AAJ8JSA1_9TREE
MSSIFTSRRKCCLHSSLSRTLRPVEISSISFIPRYVSRIQNSSAKLAKVSRIRTFSASAHAKEKPAVNGTIKQMRILDMSQFPPERIRNLSIIAHIDHGKSTLADRLLQMTGTVPQSSNPQFLDKLKVERDRGITVKAQTVSLIYRYKDGHEYLINLIDTPGHVDFSYEVSRSLGACEGALLLVDCSQGIQAQTLSVFHHALEANLTMLAVVNKVDLPHAHPDETSEEIASSLGLERSKHIRISAKNGFGVENVLNGIVESLPGPKMWQSEEVEKLRGLIFDTFYDQFRGVVSLVRIFSGSIKKGDKVQFIQAGRKYEVLEVGISNPDEVPVGELGNGQVGYIVCNMKNSEEAFIGDTVCWADKPVEPLPGFQPMKAMVYAGIFPVDNADFPKLEESIERLTLNDRSVSVQRESSAALSQGFRLGFLGTLHMDVFRQRLEDEYSSEVIVTAPTVPYKVIYSDDTEEYISNPVEFPELTDSRARVARVEEPMINATIFVPNDYIGAMMDLCARYRGIQQEFRVLENSDRAVLKYQLPLAEIVTEFFSELKSQSSGFASFDYEEAGYEKSDLVKLNILINTKPVDALAMIVHKQAAQSIGKAWVSKLKEVVPRQQFELSLQAAIGQKVIARDNVKAFRKDVTAGLYGGHYERKLKHLNKQKDGKKRLKKLAGNIEIPQAAFFKVLSSRPRGFATVASERRETARAGCQPKRSSMPVWPTNSFSSQSLSAFAFSEQALVNDPILTHFPETPLMAEPDAPSRVAPIPQHTISPKVRSVALASLLSLTSRPPPRHATSSRLLQLYTELYMSAPRSQLFTVSEVQTILRALRALQVREAGDKRVAEEQLNPLVEEIKTLVGDDQKARRDLELLIISSKSLYNRTIRMKDVLRAENIFRDLFPQAPSIELKDRRMYQAVQTFIMYICALAGQQNRLEDWWDRMAREGFRPNGYAWIAKMICREKIGKGEEVENILAEALLTEELPEKDASILTNFAMLVFSRLARWDVVVKAYSSIRPSTDQEDLTAIRLATSISFSQHTATHEIPIPAFNTPLRRQTYSAFLRLLSLQGHLHAALTILKHIFEDNYTPSIQDYVSLFRGFALYGDIPAFYEGTSEAGKLLGVGFAKSVNGSVMKSFEERMSGIWQRGTMASHPTENYEEADNTNQGWSLEALDNLFASFISLRPIFQPNVSSVLTANPLEAEKQNSLYAKAPNRKAVWFILCAFARLTNGDEERLRRVWNQLETKFGDNNQEGWAGWRMDNRLLWLKKALFKSQ